LVSLIFSVFGLSKPEFALGLPEGSVRAVIALSLIVIFVIFGVYLFSAIDGDTTLSRGLPLEQTQHMLENMAGRLDAVRCNESGGETTCDVLLHVESSPEGKDLAKQIVTTMATLVTAVSSFYFGSRTSSDKPAPDTKPASEPLEEG
ncbi:MAG: hypothetical protein KDI62_29845, partial [Anaerolineae bacterium]|nr:hypothetical protein [Anaerolineae bacterium]